MNGACSVSGSFMTMNTQKDMGNNSTSKDISNMRELLKSINITDYEPEILPKLLDISFQLVLKGATGCDEFAKYFQENDITPGIARYVTKQQTDVSIDDIPSRESLIKRAQEMNSMPLPDFTIDNAKNPLHLPPASSCLFATEYNYTSPATTKVSEESCALKNFPSLGVIPPEAQCQQVRPVGFTTPSNTNPVDVRPPAPFNPQSGF
ncbi:Transcription initiation factor TFIID subunit 9 [Thelohanellus kitauei]|uniref:Transcription initiation factor TFIID subunit 9 n=1 Tax=Thelohanellus kitauei TaxID=669202 RepID=A0A0C2MB17_THEKT|nr:Transcription initiation factor TFIID subunit 9 [Thelohanellus kitauei]